MVRWIQRGVWTHFGTNSPLTSTVALREHFVGKTHFSTADNMESIINTITGAQPRGLHNFINEIRMRKVWMKSVSEWIKNWEIFGQSLAIRRLSRLTRGRSMC